MRFQEFSKFTIRPHLFENKQQYKQILDTMVNAGIIDQARAQEKLKDIRTLLKRADRIIWWLRWWRIKVTGEVIESKIEQSRRDWEFTQRGGDRDFPDAPTSEEEVNQKVLQLQNLYKKITKKDYDYYVDNSIHIKEFHAVFNLLALKNHWSTMFEQSPQVNQVEWSPDLLPSDLFQRLERAENEWREKQREELEMQPDDQIVIDYGKYAWVKLDREYCDLEGRAMGHCGNTASPKEGDRILSFRTKVDGGRQKPHLTFILDKNGYLGEMKGRGNDKPSEKYHPYIIDLLKQDFVNGFKGGGYLPENNFDIDDLDASTKEQLINEKPALGGIDVLYKKEGLSKQVLDMFESQLDSSELDYYRVIENRLIIDRFDSLSEITDAFSVDRVTSDIIDIVSEGDIAHVEYIRSMAQGTLGNDGYGKDLYDTLDENTQEKIKKYVKDEAGENVDTEDFEDMVEASAAIEYMFEDSLFKGIYLGTLSKATKLLNEWLAENNFEKEEDSEQYQLVVSIDEIIDVMSEKDIKSLSDIEDWADILYYMSDTYFKMGIDIDNVYVYDAELAEYHLKEEIEEFFEMLDNRENANESRSKDSIAGKKLAVKEQMRYMLNHLGEEIAPATGEEYDELTHKNFYKKSPEVVDIATNSKRALQQFYPNGEMKTMKSGSGNFITQWYETPNEVFLVGINSVDGRIKREDVPDLKKFIDMLISAMQDGKTLHTTPHKRSMQMLKGVQKKAQDRGLNFSMQQGQEMDFGDGSDPELQFYQVTANIE